MAGSSIGRGDILVTLEDEPEESDCNGAWLRVWFRKGPHSPFEPFEECERMVYLADGVHGKEAGALLEQTLDADYDLATLARDQALRLDDEHPWAMSDLHSALGS
jgi:hypothetical protein